MTSEVARTPLYEQHIAAGGRMVAFAGFELPVQYTSVTEEHLAVRSKAGLFDVSHMGEIFVVGERAFDFIQTISCNDHSKMVIGRAQYTGLMYPEGTFVDDMLVHKMAEDEYLLVVNAANCAKDFEYLRRVASDFEGAHVENRSDAWAQLAVQGPEAFGIVQALTGVELGEIKYYRFTWGDVAGRRCLIARTGYTGEDGFELYSDPADAPAIWEAVLAEGRPKGLVPAGLGARDTLRLEAGMALYGNDIDATTTPIEANLGWIVKLPKGDFIGRDVIERQVEEGVDRCLIGFEMVDRGIARHGYPIYTGEDAFSVPTEDTEASGVVTSGTHSPTLGKAIGMAYLPPASAEVGTEFAIDTRGKRRRARVVEMPFYSRKKKKSK